jgi:hypothetical protein
MVVGLATDILEAAITADNDTMHATTHPSFDSTL